MRRILSVLSLGGFVACITPDHATIQPPSFPGLRGVMNHLPDGRWQFVVELPNADHLRTNHLESPMEALDTKVEVGHPTAGPSGWRGPTGSRAGGPSC